MFWSDNPYVTTGPFADRETGDTGGMFEIPGLLEHEQRYSCERGELALLDLPDTAVGLASTLNPAAESIPDPDEIVSIVSL